MNLSYEQYMYLFYGGILFAFLFLALSIILFFFLKVPALIGALTGSAERKAIAAIRNQNKSDSKMSPVNEGRVKVTEKMGEHRSLSKGNETEKIPPNVTTALLSDETQVLSPLTAPQGTVVVKNAEYTGQTTVLSESKNTENTRVGADKNHFAVQEQIILFESREIIV